VTQPGPTIPINIPIKIPVILDVDTGVDDACALLFAARHPALDLRAVTCVAGNADVDQVVHNTLTVLDAAGVPEVPVARGADRPLLEPARDARHVHGEDGMGDLGWPRRHSSGAVAAHAVELLRDTLTEAATKGEKVTLVPLAPLTNIALFLRTYPHAAAGLERIVFMGGSVGAGNATAAAEFNIWHDPDAAAVVLSACHELGVPVTMYGLDVFYDVEVSLDQARELSAGRSGTAADLAGRLMEFSCGRREGSAATIGDAGAVCALVDPDGLTTSRLPVRVELAGTWTRGRTVVDGRTAAGDLDNDPHGVAPTQVDVALAVDGKRYADLWLDTMRGPAR
jgi:pyrimidine-specific ribonucleoside hydrolase